VSFSIILCFGGADYVVIPGGHRIQNLLKNDEFSSIDLGLYLIERIAGKEIRKKIQTQMDYLNYPL